MYWSLRILLSFLSRLPFAFFYALSDLAFVILFYVVRYRRNVVDQNLAIAFPEKTVNERKAIARSFYKNFTDTFAESVKLLTISPEQAAARCEIDIQALIEMEKKGRHIKLMAAHQFNWEFVHLTLPSQLKLPFYLVYRPIETPALEKIYFDFRSKGGCIPLSADDFARMRAQLFSDPVILALVADQNPGRVSSALWLNFFNRPAPFFIGPAKGAVLQGAAVVMLQVKRIKRGHYRFIARVITEDASKYTPQQLTLLYKNEVERVIQEDPSNYLWSHRRWRHAWKPEYGEVYDGTPTI